MIFTVLLGLGERMINLFFALLLVFPVIVEANCADKLNVLECMKKEHDQKMIQICKGRMDKKVCQERMKQIRKQNSMAQAGESGKTQTKLAQQKATNLQQHQAKLVQQENSQLEQQLQAKLAQQKKQLEQQCQAKLAQQKATNLQQHQAKLAQQKKQLEQQCQAKLAQQKATNLQQHQAKLVQQENSQLGQQLQAKLAQQKKQLEQQFQAKLAQQKKQLEQQFQAKLAQQERNYTSKLTGQCKSRRVDYLKEQRTTDYQHSLTATITYPAQGAIVPRVVFIRGKLTGKKHDQKVFLVIRSTKFGKRFYPLGAIKKRNWTVKGIYATPNYNYETFVVATSNKKSIALLRRKRSRMYGLKKLPHGTKVISAIIVVKRK
ncbi:hypothetical protein TI05_03825 [Achromatium sp. WMS3]|nr:hypothetical protein TI05_03825 [Achromatium sp. WMS3]